uniref:Uncharacterized protein n=6 Tax=Vibrionaceae TaxID=641 RepID=A0A0H3ZNQ7_9VIBR|nr:hypothetical protein [Vibrio splendidus]AKN36651.1 hypothetical protein [Vibrio sp. FF_482]AKN37825.1 hypothetical protein [Vibrio tasmaniensis]AKN38735.1 hypothetical protein [Enterovibrio norvegicus]AKN39125.1 hypothetical protein [Vibrio kanaloae]AKN39958.1 hypothetical protein [Vibrio sp. FF_307]
MGRQNIPDSEIWSWGGNNDKPDPNRFEKGNESGQTAKAPKDTDHNFQMNRADQNLQYILRNGKLPWDENERYAVGSIVYLSGLEYECIANSVSNNPAVSPSYWNPISNDYKPRDIGTIDFDTLGKTGWYIAEGTAEGSFNAPSSNKTLVRVWRLSDWIYQKAESYYNPAEQYHRCFRTTQTAVNWTKHYNTSFKPNAADVGARPDDWMPTAADVGARPDDWMPTAADVGARPDDWMPTAADVGARPDDWMPTAADVGAMPAEDAFKIQPKDVGSIDFDTLATSGWYEVQGTAGGSDNAPSSNALLVKVWRFSNWIYQEAVSYFNEYEQYFRCFNTSQKDTPWEMRYSTAYKPKLEDLGLEHVGKAVVGTSVQANDVSDSYVEFYDYGADDFDLVSFDPSQYETHIYHTGYYLVDVEVLRNDTSTVSGNGINAVVMQNSIQVMHGFVPKATADKRNAIRMRRVLKLNSGDKIKVYTDKDGEWTDGGSIGFQYLKPLTN